MIKIENNIKSIIRIIIIFILLNIISNEIEECERENPIKTENGCFSLYCSESEFQSGKCIKSNSIIRTQWLNNIILVGEKNYRYCNFVSSNNGKMIFYTTAYPDTKERIYFGINTNGDPIFKDSNDNNTYIYKKNAFQNDSNTYESISGIIKINGDINENKEYFIAIGKSKANTEIFDFDNYGNELKKIKYKNIVKYFIELNLGNIISIVENDIYYYIIGLIKRVDSKTFEFYLIKFNIDSNGKDISCYSNESISFSSVDNKIVYCFLLDEDIIICMYITNTKYFKILFFNTNLENKGEYQLSIQYDSLITIFYKFFHYKDDLSLFTYYHVENENYYPIIQIIETKIIESSYSVNMAGSIILDKYNFNNGDMLTDIIIIRDNLLCLLSTKEDHETLIIVLINFYNGLEYNLRYYLIDIFKLYKQKIYGEVKLHSFNNNLIFGYSHYKYSADSDESDEVYSSIFFCSYPNITDYNLDIISYLNKNENNNIIINLSDIVNIDNNIFGYILYQIKIFSIDNCGINFISNTTNKIIKENDYLSKNENLELIFTENEYQIQTCSIKFRPIITEPDYEEFNKYPNYILKESDINEQQNFEKILYEGKVGYYNISINKDLIINCDEENINCNLCLKNNKSQCLIYNYTINSINSIKIYNETDIPTTNNESNLKSQNEKKIGYCEIGVIVDGNCSDIILTNEDLKEMYQYIKDEKLNKNYTRENIIISTSESCFQLSTLEDQMSSDYSISSIELKECEKLLKENNNIDDDEPLIIYKIDIKNNDLSTTYVKYEIYHPYTLELLNLSCCDKTNIIMNIPVDLDSETISLYDSLSQYGYNLFNPNDSFYNDVCSTFKSENGTDITLLDRKKDYYIKYGNKTLCQNGCTINKYNSTNKKVVCQCSIKYEKNELDLNDINSFFNPKEFIGSFLVTLKNSNFLVLKCFKLVFNLNNFILNIGMIIMSIILIISIISILMYYFKEKKNINFYIESVLKMKFFIENLEKKKAKRNSSI